VNQFNSRTEAAKSRLDAENRSSGPLARLSTFNFEMMEFMSGLLEHGMHQPGSKLFLFGPAIQFFKAFAHRRGEERIEYLLNQVADDLVDAITKVDGHEGSLEDHETRIKLIESILDPSRFTELLGEAGIQALRASGPEKIKRLARVAVSGATHRKTDAIERALEFERHAVELDDLDVSLLRLMENYQAKLRTKGIFREDEWLDGVRRTWQEMTRENGYGEASAREARSSFARLQSRGLVIQIPSVATVNSPGTEPYAVLDEGASFLTYLVGQADKTANG
jgi:hypothetical protein